MDSDKEDNLILPSDEELEKVNEVTQKREGRRSKNEKSTTIAVKLTEDEVLYRQKNFSDLVVKNLKLLCTCCGKNLLINFSIKKHSSTVASHPFLEVLLCKKCADFYGEGDFSVDEDGTDKYCRWCGQGGTLYLCSDCNFGFCRACIKRNLHRSVLEDVDCDDWKCFCCNPKPLWELRGICAATLEEILKTKEKKKKEKRALRKSTKRAVISSSCDSEEEQMREKRKKRTMSESPYSKRHEKKKRMKMDEDEDTEYSVERSSKDRKYNKSVDRKTTLSDKAAEEFISTFEEHSSNFINVINAIKYEAKEVLKKKKLTVELVQSFEGRFKVIEELMELRDLSLKTINQSFENFIMAYRSVIMQSVCQNSENSAVDSEGNVATEIRPGKSQLDKKESDICSKSLNSFDQCNVNDDSQDNLQTSERQEDSVLLENSEEVSSSQDKVPKDIGDSGSDSDSDSHVLKKGDISCTDIELPEGEESMNNNFDSSMQQEDDQQGSESSDEDTVCSEKNDDSSRLDIKNDKKIKPKTKRNDVPSESDKILESEINCSTEKKSKSVCDSSENDTLSVDTVDNGAELNFLSTKRKVIVESADEDSLSDSAVDTQQKSCSNSLPSDMADSENIANEDGMKEVCKLESEIDKVISDLNSISEGKDCNLADEDEKKNKSLNSSQPDPSVEDSCSINKIIDDDEDSNEKLSASLLSTGRIGNISTFHTNLNENISSNLNSEPDKHKRYNRKKERDGDENMILTDDGGSNSGDSDSDSDQNLNKKKKKNTLLAKIIVDQKEEFLDIKNKKINALLSDTDESDDQGRSIEKIGKRNKVTSDVHKVKKSGGKENGKVVMSDSDNDDQNKNHKKVKGREKNVKSHRSEDEFCIDIGKNETVKFLMSDSDNDVDELGNNGKKGEGNDINKTMSDTDNDDLDGEEKNTERSEKVSFQDLGDKVEKNENNSENENRKAMFSLLLSSSEDGYSSGEINTFSSKINLNVKGTVSHKTVCSINHLKKEKLLHNSIYTDSDSETGETLKHKSAVKETNHINGYNYPEVRNCSVMVKKLNEDVFQNYFDKPHNSNEGTRKQPSEEEEINKLVNLKTLAVSAKKKVVSTSDSDDDNKETNVPRKKVLKKHVKKSEEKTLKDFHNSNTDESLNDSDHSDNSEESTTRGRPSLKNILEQMNERKNKYAEELLLKSSSSDSEGVNEEVTNKTTVKKERKIKERKSEKVDEKEVDIRKEKKSSESSDESIETTKKAPWRSDKLLRMKLSESDTSDDERRWNAKKEREAKEEAKGRKKKQKRFIVNSDSDPVILSSESSDTDSDNIFKVTNKRKHKESSGSEKSKNKSGSDSDKSEKKKVKRRRIRKPASDSSDSEDEKNISQKSGDTPNKGRKNIRRVLKDDNVGEKTRRAAKEEEERRKRISEKQKLYNALYSVAEAQSEVTDKLVLDFDAESKKELLEVDKLLVKQLKPHQVKGVKFMWDACFESLERIKGSEGSGCILAHCMGLGKTLQVITLVHTLLNNEETKMKTVMVVCPLSTVLNWVNEFSKWLDQLEDNDIEVFELTKYKQMYERVGVIKHWYQSGGVMIIGYNLFRTLTNSNTRRQKKRSREILQQSLVDPGPDLVICDEGHLLKNEGSALSKAMNLLKTKRRIVLTGTPLQNNLLEYHCMVQFVKPNLLGTKKEFLNRFVNPINNGQYENSTSYDVKVMKRRAHVLHKMLDSSVQRYDYSVLTPFLPPKFEYALSIRLTELQIKLYRHYLDNYGAPIGEDGVRTKAATLFKDYQALSKIWTHPRVLLMNSIKVEKKRLLESDSEGSLRDFIASGSTSSSSSSSSSDSDVQEVNSEDNSETRKKSKNKRITRSVKTGGLDDSDNEGSEGEGEGDGNFKNPEDWWRQFMSDESELDDIRQSGKLSLLFTLLDECEKIGDKLLVFSQSLFSLDLIEYFLAKIDEANQNQEKLENLLGYTASWSLGLDYFRLDGSSSPENRSAWCKAFNREDNMRARLFLISTRAGGLGINLVAANRVVIFDASWNPSHDLQSIFRVFRFGQKKPCYIYRFLAQATMEEKIYNRQVTKLSLACRVVDEQQIERHYSMNDLQELYIFNPEEKPANTTPLVPKDIMLAELVRGEDSWIMSYHEHDTLLENKEEEELNEEERKAAWEDYEKEKQGLRVNANQFGNANFMAYLNAYGFTEHSIRENIVKQNPQFSETQIQHQTSVVLRQLYNYISTEGYRRSLQAQQTYSRQAEPVYLQNPQMQPHTQMHNMPQENLYSSMQQQPPPIQSSSYSLNRTNHLENLLVQQKEISKLRDYEASSSVNNGTNQRLMVKSVDQMNRGNSGNPLPQVLTNPFSYHQAPASVISHTANVHTGAGGAAQRRRVQPPKYPNTDVIDIE